MHLLPSVGWVPVKEKCMGVLFTFWKLYWKEILPAVALGLFILWVVGLKTERDEAVHKLGVLQYQMEAAVKAKKLEIDAKDKQAESDLMEAQKVHDESMKANNLDRVESTKELKDLYETKITNLKHSMDSRTGELLPPAYDCAIGMPDTAPSSEGVASSGEFDYAGAYRTLEKACQIETLDYNQLREWADTACEEVGCKE
jgi:hypothetical protein